MIQSILRKVIEGQDLTREEAASAMNSIMSGDCTDAQIAAFIIALRMKGETAEEIAGCVEVMRRKATPVNPGESEYQVVDIVGTGGDRKNTFNVSTAAALVAAGAGVTVAKHGNKSVSSQSGSADVLAALGVKIDADVATVERCLREAGIGYLFAPMLHAAMKYAIGPRREIGVRTVFNILGPLTNPAGAPCLVLGVYDPGLVTIMADALLSLGAGRSFVVHSHDGMDEITVTGPTHIAELVNGSANEYDVSPEDFGLERAPLDSLLVASPEESAAAIRAILDGETGPKRDVALLNAAAAIAASGAADNLMDGLLRAAESIDSGRGREALDTLVRVSNEQGATHARPESRARHRRAPG